VAYATHSQSQAPIIPHQKTHMNNSKHQAHVVAELFEDTYQDRHCTNNQYYLSTPHALGTKMYERR
jgi:hypothetical protein